MKSRLTFGQAEGAHRDQGSFGAADGGAGDRDSSESSASSNSGAAPAGSGSPENEGKIVPLISAADISNTGNIKYYILNMYNIKY